MRIDIFCDIVDNYGDAGVCWRLAKRFAQTSPSPYRDSIRLFCDDLNLLHLLAGGDALSVAKELGIEILPWEKSSPSIDSKDPWRAPDLIIEAFGCSLPKPYLEKISLDPDCVILNLEYLSAEDWIESHHGLASPGLELKKYFFFPGFTARSGTVLKGPLPDSKTPVPQSLSAFWGKVRPEALKICLFCYNTPSMKEFVQSLLNLDQKLDLLVCQGQAKDLAQDLHVKPGSQALEVPFVSQEDFDWLLASADLNIVRGEDSFVRAQWAAKPMIWQIYPQHDHAHELKLEAFLKKYLRSADPGVSEAIEAAMHMRKPTTWFDKLGKIQNHAQSWRNYLDQLCLEGDLAIQIRKFLKETEKSGKI